MAWNGRYYRLVYFYLFVVKATVLGVLVFMCFTRSRGISIAPAQNKRQRSRLCPNPTTHENVLWSIVRGLFSEERIPEGDILDVGASTGEMSCFLACLDSGRVVHAMDPNRISMESLHCQTGNVVKHVSAMSGVPGTIVWKPSNKNDYVGDLNRRNVKGGDVPVTTLDMFFNQTRSAPGFLHLDVEGYELAVLQGGVHTIMKYRPLIVVEIHVFKMHRETSAHSDNAKRIFEMMEGMDYSLFMVNEICGTWNSCRNYIAVPSEHVSVYKSSGVFILGFSARIIVETGASDFEAKYNQHKSTAVPWEHAVHPSLGRQLYR